MEWEARQEHQGGMRGGRGARLGAPGLPAVPAVRPPGGRGAAAARAGHPARHGRLAGRQHRLQRLPQARAAAAWPRNERRRLAAGCVALAPCLPHHRACARQECHVAGAAVVLPSMRLQPHMSQCDMCLCPSQVHMLAHAACRLHGRAGTCCLPAPQTSLPNCTFGPLAPSPLRLSALTYTRSLANYTAETGFAPATHDVFIEAPMSAVDRANLDLVLPQIAAMQTFVSALARLLRCRGMIMVMLGFREVRTACGLLRPGTRRARGHACAARCQSRARICRAAAGTQCFECCVRCTWHACCAVRQRRQPAEPA